MYVYIYIYHQKNTFQNIRHLILNHILVFLKIQLHLNVTYKLYYIYMTFKKIS